MSQIGNFDRIAPYYDLLKRVVFGDSIQRAHLFALSQIPSGSSLLIIGGGTGEILEQLAKLFTDLEIVYLDASEVMQSIAKKRFIGANKVEFVTAQFEEYSLRATPFDCILTPFLWDLFPEEAFPTAFQNMTDRLKSGGYWMNIDFKLHDREPLWQKLLLGSMYKFFRFTADLKTEKLVRIENFTKNNYKEISSQEFYGVFIRSTIYQKIQD